MKFKSRLRCFRTERSTRSHAQPICACEFRTCDGRMRNARACSTLANTTRAACAIHAIESKVFLGWPRTASAIHLRTHLYNPRHRAWLLFNMTLHRKRNPPANAMSPHMQNRRIPHAVNAGTRRSSPSDNCCRKANADGRHQPHRRPTPPNDCCRKANLDVGSQHHRRASPSYNRPAGGKTKISTSQLKPRDRRRHTLGPRAPYDSDARSNSLKSLGLPLPRLAFMH